MMLQHPKEEGLTDKKTKQKCLALPCPSPLYPCWSGGLFPCPPPQSRYCPTGYSPSDPSHLVRPTIHHIKKINNKSYQQNAYQQKHKNKSIKTKFNKHTVSQSSNLHAKIQN